MKNYNYHRYNSFAIDLMRGLFVTIFILLVLFFVSVTSASGQHVSNKMESYIAAKQQRVSHKSYIYLVTCAE